MNFRTALLPIAALFLIVPAGAASAQTDSDLLFAPWNIKTFLELRSEALVANAGHIDGKGSDHFWQLSTQGRVRLGDSHEINPSLGFDGFHLDTGSNDPRIPRQLDDASVAFATPIGTANGWFAGILAGLGYAGDNAFGDNRAYYGLAQFYVGRQLHPNEDMLFILDYNGNRVFFPDVPLPGIAYHRKFSENFDLVVGFPDSSVRWKPLDDLTLRADISVFSSVNLEARYRAAKGLELFAGLIDQEQPFYIDGQPRTHRLFFQQYRAQVGVCWQPSPGIQLQATTGYLFGRQFSDGFNDFDTSNIA
ncbi:MAG: hypothetical protein ABSH20_28965, partial [Tepidisphaeraceae bacterium]